MPRPLPTPGNFTFKPVPRAAGLRPRREEAVSELVLESCRFLELGRLLLRLLPWLVSRRGLRQSGAPCFGARDLWPEPEVEGCWLSRPAPCAAQPLTVLA